jgi:hypothetical protein
MAVERTRNVGMGDGWKINACCAVECAVSPRLRRPISGFGLKARPKNILDDVLMFRRLCGMSRSALGNSRWSARPYVNARRFNDLY